MRDVTFEPPLSFELTELLGLSMEYGCGESWVLGGGARCACESRARQVQVRGLMTLILSVL